MKTKVIGLGAGGHARVVIDALRHDARCEIVGLLDARAELQGTAVESVRVLGDDERLDGLVAEGIGHFFLGLGGIGDQGLRQKLFEKARSKGLAAWRVVHPGATLAGGAEIGEGLVMLAGSILNPGSRLGVNVLLNTGSLVEHDCVIGDHTHIAPGACVLGSVEIGPHCFIGSRSVIRQGLRIGRGALVGMGSVVVKDVEEGQRVAGNPARPLA